MITVTFEPTNPEQAALLGEFLPQYMRAGQLVVSGAPADVKAVVEQAAAAAEEKAAPKATRAKKPAPAAAAADAPASSTAETSAPTATTATNTTTQAAPTPTATTAETEGNATPAATSTASPSASAASSTASVKLEDVRALLADLSQAGKGAQVKALIAETGATKLTEVPAEKYAELLEKAKAL